MSQEKTHDEIEELRKHVQELLNMQVRQTGLAFTLKVLDEYIQQEDWLYLVVIPDQQGVRAYDYAKVLTDVENKLRRDEHVEGVLLVPALAA
ncbi:MAG: hypothetical protein EHM48_02690 [Planctomycetaceae bacterium]|nr:MAG: hypothetical protein EHM48_02690 [Planctomycetaceae bacterium]